jgi:hypothetical protein
VSLIRAKAPPTHATDGYFSCLHYTLLHRYLPPRDLRFPPGLDDGSVTPQQVATGLAQHCYDTLGKGCIIDLSYLHLDSGAMFHKVPGGDDKRFAKDHKGERCTMRSIVGYCDETGTCVPVAWYLNMCGV